ncbi:MAG: hypothetical protein EPN39_11765 [Chitinophagaceae bacterium]|nr:MAG: hypothetical protein EPN39_11765 [Chitinophagaceae bacterium]
MKINWKKNILPHVIAIVVFIILGFAYCNPVLQGNAVSQGDMTQVEGMAHASKMFYDSTHQTPLWTNSMFGGMPSYLFYTGPSSNKIAFLNNLTTLWLPNPVNMLFIAMLGMYFLLCIFGFKYWVRLFGAVAYGFSSFNVILITAGHVTELMTMAWMAPVLAGVILLYRGRYLFGGVITALASALLIYNNHFQIIYYTLIMLGFLVIGQLIMAIKEKQFKKFIIASLICIGAAIIAAIPSSDNLLITHEYSKYSTRGSQSQITLVNNTESQVKKGGLGLDYAYMWSLGKLETFSILIPNIYGGPPQSPDFISNSKTFQTLSQMGVGQQQAANISQHFLYWGPQPFTTPVYFGALICFFFIFSFFLIKSKYKWWILAITLLSFFMAWGKNFSALNDFLFYHLPLYNKFRAPSMMMVIPQLTFIIMACWTLNELLSGKLNKKEIWDGLKKTLYITVGMIVLVWIIAGSMGFTGGPDDASFRQQAGEKVMNAIRDDRASLMHKDAARALILVLLLFAALWALIKEKIKPVHFFVIASVLLLFDLFRVDSRYLNSNNYVPSDELAGIIQPSPADQQILQDKDPDYRVLNLSGGMQPIFNDALTSYFHNSVGGYSPAKLWRYQDLIDFQITPAIQNIYATLQNKKALDSSDLNIFNSSPILNLLNTKYFIINPNGAPVVNKDALGNAWFVSNIQWEPNADSEMLAMNHFDPKTTAVINQSFKGSLNGETALTDSTTHIQLTHYSLNDMQYASDNAQNGFAVFSEIYYPAGWKAYIDGKESPIIRVDYAFRGLMIPAGKHTIEFKFHPKTYFLGQEISGISSVILILLVIAGLVWEITRRMKVEAIPEAPEKVIPVKKVVKPGNKK